MLTVEHEAAERLRNERLRAYAPIRGRHDGLGWLFEILGWRAPARS